VDRDDGIPRIIEDTDDVAVRETVSFTKVVPQSFVLMARVTAAEQLEASQEGEAAAAGPGS